ncbi:MAG: histidine kinase [Reichenbachiella sp.]|uniref:sensor histidine kinase n=1 Tax=Reichenbachiella sp. TaxID=2184521 RepID=UPI0032636D10
MKSIVETSKGFIRQYSYWVFTIGMGILLVLSEEILEEPFFSFAVFIYCVLLTYWAARWLFRRIGISLSQKREKASTEIQHLQSQVSPHFFFNTLNNLYGLIDKDANQAKEMVLKLSDLMRYSIYEGQKEWVTLEEELSYIQNYIELHRARYHKHTDIKVNLHIQHEGLEIMPLLFIILLENAFKHGVENLRENAYVSLHLIAGENEISFAIENNFDPGQIEDSPGIGLQNLKRRLQLVYPKKHVLSYSSNGDIFKAQLTLQTK